MDGQETSKVSGSSPWFILGGIVFVLWLGSLCLGQYAAGQMVKANGSFGKALTESLSDDESNSEEARRDVEEGIEASEPLVRIFALVFSSVFCVIGSVGAFVILTAAVFIFGGKGDTSVPLEPKD